MENIIVSEVDNEVVTITLNRPEKKNALSVALRDEISDTLNKLSGKSNVKAVVITGAGDVFSAGFDLKEFQKGMKDTDFNGMLWASSDRFHHTILFFPLPIIAAVNGPAIAGGFDLASMCDIRVCTENTVFSHPEISFSEVMYSPLHELLGGALARDLCLTGREVTAQEAKQINLVTSVVPQSSLEEEVKRITAQINRASRDLLLTTKSKILQRANITGRLTLEL
ncbi:MAG: enoyl-CoA hydratase/isomerase family protein [Deltaproteobacteria bacterium]|nr:enoyl-CoA hydratase/isomerase family protein [Deltaproteobacteria bacterium]